MLKRLFNEDTLTVLLLWALGVVGFIYLSYFVIFSPSWSLIEEYKLVRFATAPDFSIWSYFTSVIQKTVAIGRFKPINEFWMALRMGALPIKPEIFRFIQWGITAGVLVLFIRVLRQLGLSPFRALLGAFFASIGFSTKDMLQYWAPSEPLMLLFFFASFTSFLGRAYLPAFVLYVCAFLTKETAVSFLGVFGLYLLLERRKANQRQWVFFGACVVAVAVFMAFIFSLPRGYTGHYGLGNVTLPRLYDAYVVPLVRNYGAVFLVLGALCLKLRPRLNVPVLTLGLAIALGYTAILVPWGPFDSWFYLHAPVPFGWAAVLAALWPEARESWTQKRWQIVALAGVVFFGFFVVMNGSRNYKDLVLEAKQVARAVCEENARQRGLQFYSNCFEASGQLIHYLHVEKLCEKPPVIKYLTIEEFKAQFPKKKSYIFVASSKCDYPIESMPTPYKAEWRYWTIYKNIPPSSKQ